PRDPLPTRRSSGLWITFARLQTGSRGPFATGDAATDQSRPVAEVAANVAPEAGVPVKVESVFGIAQLPRPPTRLVGESTDMKGMVPTRWRPTRMPTVPKTSSYTPTGVSA